MLVSNKQMSRRAVLSVSKLLVLIVLAGSACTISCRKEKMYFPSPSFFKNTQDANAKVQREIARFHSDELLESIQRISYLNGKDRSYAFIYYKSNKGLKSLAIEADLGVDADGAGWTTYECDGTCDCNVVGTVSSGGVIKFKCSCASCDLITHGAGN
jgi:hypothetical protein